jgi:hypothetical protein
VAKKRQILQFFILSILIFACQEDPPSSPKPSPSPLLSTPSIQAEPLMVWIDNPVTDTTVQGDQVSITIHSNVPTGQAELWIWDSNKNLVERFPMGEPVARLVLGGQLMRYERIWIAPILPATYTFEAVVGNIVSERVVVEVIPE